jgi:hypothetical protein
MKRFALGCTSLFLLFFTISTYAQETKATTDESSIVSATVRNYIEAYYTGDAARMEQTLHPHYLKHIIHGDIPMRERTGSEMIGDVRSQGATNIPQAERTEQVSVLDVSGEMASAKLIAAHWVDYVTLSKWNGEWKILSVVQRIEN